MVLGPRSLNASRSVDTSGPRIACFEYAQAISYLHVFDVFVNDTVSVDLIPTMMVVP